MRIRIPIFIIILMAAISFGSRSSDNLGTAKAFQTALQPNSLCARDERIIFSCPVRKPAKIVSLCASKDLGA